MNTSIYFKTLLTLYKGGNICGQVAYFEYLQLSGCQICLGKTGLQNKWMSSGFSLNKYTLKKTALLIEDIYIYI